MRMPRNDRMSMSELEGPYLRAMQEIAQTLMENLPACDELWRILAESEARLLAAQCDGMSVKDVFAPRGMAAYCQLIIDDFHAQRATDGDQPPFIPAAIDRSVKRQSPKRDPRGGVRYNRLKWGTRAFAALLIVACLYVGVTYTGLWHYFTGGSSYYQDELYNFQISTTPLPGTQVHFQMKMDPGQKNDGLLYADARGFRVTLRAVGYDQNLKQSMTPSGASTADASRRFGYPWYVELLYTLDSTFTDVAYVEPNVNGATAIITYPDGSTVTNELSIFESGAAGEGYEYIRLYIGLFATDEPFEEMTVTVNLPGFQLVENHRIGTGKR